MQSTSLSFPGIMIDSLETGELCVSNRMGLSLLE